ncbi:DMT family transporter [Shewanella litoralis]|uniref:Membrane protein n=1 Tax=Shewanella litoralis TaxID=2282700 RepID=A0ABQ2R9P3_9GAMM|nr:DMT family transporter [Shewanella litoralis]GGQ16930.1 membrane protein [Shewanella litoralis]
MASATPLSRSALTFYTLIALIAFAANSVFCRLALSNEQAVPLIDPSSFTAIRLTSGALMLALLMLLTSAKKRSTQDLATENRATKHTLPTQAHGSFLAAGLLFVYAIGFSYAYVLLDTATGALVLFAAVQISMMFISYLQGHRLNVLEIVGALVAFAGFGYLVWPSISLGSETLSISGLVLMAISGCAWGGYTLMGKGAAKPLFATGYNFIRTLPLVLLMLASVWLLSMLMPVDPMQSESAGLAFHLSTQGIVLAILSGALASGVGYALWYQALRGLSANHAAVLQLSVPVIAAVGGVIFVGEQISVHLIICTSIILFGIALVIFAKTKHKL